MSLSEGEAADFIPGDANDPHWLRTMAAGVAARGQTGDAARLSAAADEIVRLRRLNDAIVVVARAIALSSSLETKGGAT